MTGTRLLRSTIAASALTLGLLCAVASPAAASGASERRQERRGARIVSEVGAGKSAPESRYGSLYGWMGAMMGGYGGPGLADRTSRYLRDRDGASAGDGYDMGPGMMHGSGEGPYGAAGEAGGGWPTAAIVAVAVLGALLVGGALALALPRLRRGGRDSTAPTARP